MIRYGSGVSNDSRFLKEIYLPKGSIIVFDRGYHDFATFNRFTSEGVTWVTRRTKNFAMKMNDQIERSENDDCVISDTSVRIGHKDTKDKVNARLVQYLDPDTGELYEFVTNNLRMNAATIAGLYKKRWQIETLFKRLKQNYPLKYFLGDSENAIKIQIWCSLIADLLLKIIKKAVSVRWSFSNLAAMVRLHLMTYIDLFSFLKAPEKALLRLFYTPQKEDYNQLCLIT
jgi:transposase